MSSHMNLTEVSLYNDSNYITQLAVCNLFCVILLILTWLLDVLLIEGNYLRSKTFYYLIVMKK